MNDFKFHWISQNEMPDHIDSIKDKFNLFDFFGNYEYFEKDFDYDEILKLPQKPSIPIDPPIDVDPVDEVTNYNADPLKFIEEITISAEGMKIDRDLYRSFQSVVTDDSTIRNFVENMEFESAENYLEENILDKPDEYFTLQKLGKSLELDRKLSVSELLLHAFGHIDQIKTKNECLDEDFEKLDDELNPSDDNFHDAKQFFESYAIDPEYREIIDSKKFAQLNVHPSGQAFKNLPKELREMIPQFIKENVNLERFSSA